VTVPRTFIITGLILSACFIAEQAFAQETRNETILKEKAEKAAAVEPERREKGDRIVTKLERLFMPQPPALRLTAGNFRPGAGFALGAAYAAPLGRGLWDTQVAWSVHNFKQVESSVLLPLVTGDRLQIRPFIKWNDAPDLKFFGVGNDSSRSNEVSYALRTVDAGAELEARARWFYYGAGLGYFGAHSGEGHGFLPIGNIFTPVNTPGLGSHPTWIHTAAHAGVDTRQSPGYTTRGAFYGATFHQYTDPNDKFSFSRAEIDLRQFIPVLNENWVIALQGRADLTYTGDGQVIPYFMLPTLGGRDTLPSFKEYRFTDRQSLLLRTELRWTASPMVDMAFFFDQGKVAPRVGLLNLDDLKRGGGVGARFHGPNFTALRVEVAHGFEGWRFVAAHSISF
jgi:hypothetical protein